VLVEDEFGQIEPNDLWIYNKLQLSKMLGYKCGPVGCKIEEEGWYIIRPAINFLGMGRNAVKHWLGYSANPDNYGNPGDFWCEWFEGDHLSIDFYKGECVLVVKGIKKESEEKSRWEKWVKIDQKVDLPPILHSISEKYDKINIEMIGDKIIEVHLRDNPDFVWENEVAIPVYDLQKQICPDGFRFVESEDYNRKGFFIK
jgi:hypothetical protein